MARPIKGLVSPVWLRPGSLHCPKPPPKPSRYDCVLYAEMLWPRQLRTTRWMWKFQAEFLFNLGNCYTNLISSEEHDFMLVAYDNMWKLKLKSYDKKIEKLKLADSVPLKQNQQNGGFVNSWFWCIIKWVMRLFSANSHSYYYAKLSDSYQYTIFAIPRVLWSIYWIIAVISTYRYYWSLHYVMAIYCPWSHY